MLGDTFTVIGRSFVVLANVAVMFVAIPAVINIAAVVLAPLSPLFSVLSVIGALASGVGALLAYGAIFQLAMADLHGQSISTGAMFKTAMRKFWPMLGLLLLLVLAVVLGALLLMVPSFLLGMSGLGIMVGLGMFVVSLLLIVLGVMAGLALSVALPVLVLENRSIFESINRSAALTRKKRWSIFLLYFLVGLVGAIAELVLFAIFGGFHDLVAHQPSTVDTVLSALMSVVAVPFGAVLSTALLHQLRGNSGYGAEAVAEVFA